ncbi:GAF domain-containing protein [Hymenobacter sp. HMF4947]|uniref:histidine kinase n=1 Tax=Hymenobacter ginkgonis TaxID=2682976 RepID=A0A7K1THZ8_9BACT|nr:ATP-binding protein [Hymenobacter ginkgonis]MVN77936.1 GAF domain-containing protein [Hymenobacter ginkgonis]
MAQSAVSFTDESLVGATITLTNCDREPIHIPGLVQPYGFLLCLAEDTHRIVQASANTQALIGLAAEDLLGKGLEELLGPGRLAEVAALLPTLTETTKLLGVRLKHVAGQPFYKLILHRYDGLLWAEFEPLAEEEASVLSLPALNNTLSQMLSATNVLDFCQYAVEQVRDITGFARVAMYRFAADESGEVVAEAKRDDLDPLLGLHYPATDIPQQARAMYLKNWLRFIPDIDYAPTPLVPARTPGTGRPPDMTYAVLRSVSPIHIEYLRNMGVAATMTISIIQDGKLWGMVMCHHDAPRLVSYELRELCLFIGKTFSALLSTKEQLETHAYQLRLQQAQVRLLEQVSNHVNFVEGLYQPVPIVLDVLNCGGAAICFDGEVVRLGNAPTPPQIRELATWLDEHLEEDVFHTDSYARLNQAGLAMRATASGVLAVALAQEPGNYLFWFRPELLQTVRWAGKHEKVHKMEDGQLFLSPRQSFAAWAQTVESTAAPWLPLELETANAIRLHIADVRLKVFNELQARAASLGRLNTELARSNDELDSFAYVASHDLKEPLRGIHNYSIFLLEDYAELLDADGVDKLQTLVRLSQRMEALIDSLLQLSRVGRLDLELVPTDMNELVADVLDLLRPRFEQTHTTVDVRGPLPTIEADAVRLREVFNNLFTNAIKYNNKPERRITVGWAPAGKAGPRGAANPADYDVFYVQDNGIGIEQRHHESIFRIFKRLHAQDKFGGGTGAGLAIAKKMVEKHGGELWVESVLGQGATFYFSLLKAH